MKTLGAILIIVGLLASTVGHGQYVHVNCNCSVQMTGQPSACSCVEFQEPIANGLIFTGIAITVSGIVMFSRKLLKEESKV